MKTNGKKGLWMAALCLMGLCMLLFNILTPMICDDYRYAFSFATGERITGVLEILRRWRLTGMCSTDGMRPIFSCNCSLCCRRFVLMW